MFKDKRNFFLLPLYIFSFFFFFFIFFLSFSNSLITAFNITFYLFLPGFVYSFLFLDNLKLEIIEFIIISFVLSIIFQIFSLFLFITFFEIPLLNLELYFITLFLIFIELLFYFINKNYFHLIKQKLKI